MTAETRQLALVNAANCGNSILLQSKSSMFSFLARFSTRTSACPLTTTWSNSGILTNRQLGCTSSSSKMKTSWIVDLVLFTHVGHATSESWKTYRLELKPSKFGRTVHENVNVHIILTDAISEWHVFKSIKSNHSHLQISVGNQPRHTDCRTNWCGQSWRLRADMRVGYRSPPMWKTPGYGTGCIVIIDSEPHTVSLLITKSHERTTVKFGNIKIFGTWTYPHNLTLNSNETSHTIT